MSLQAWSLVYFGSTALLYFMIYMSMFQSPSIKRFFLLVVSWVVHMTALMWYGIATAQLGFILMFFLELMMIAFVYVITGKVVKDEDL